MSERVTSWRNVGSVARLELLVSAAVQNAARGLSGMVGRTITTGTTQARVVGFNEVSDAVGDPESEMVGVYLVMEGSLNGQSIIILPLESALNLADVLCYEPPGTSTALEELQRSALAEVGNMVVSYFLNGIASLTGETLRPSPPAVMVDMLSAILNVVITPIAYTTDDVLIIDTAFNDPSAQVQARFWVLPDISVAGNGF